MPSALYIDPQNQQFYLIPDHTELPAGALRLRSLSGAERAIDPDVASVFAASEEDVAGHLRERVGALAASLRERTGRLAPPGAEGARLAEALGIPVEALEDPRQVREALSRTLAGWRASLRAERSATPAELQARIAKLAELARERELPELADAAERLPETLRSFAADPERLAQLRSATAALREAAAELRQKRKARS